MSFSRPASHRHILRRSPADRIPVRIIRPTERSRRLSVSATQTTLEPATHDARRRLVLVDGHGLAFRAYHALPPTMSTSAGEPTNATFGFTSMLLDVLRAHQPDCV